MKVASYTLGCKVNQYETEALEELFKNNQYEIVGFEDYADIYLVNSCSVTALAEKKSRQMIHRAKRKNPNSIVAILGCYAQRAQETLKEIEDIDIIIGNNKKKDVVQIIEEYLQGKEEKEFVIQIDKEKEFEELSIESLKNRTRAFIKIQDGCNNFCSYCIIPYVRGRIRSRNPESILKEVQKLADNGFKEIVLTGIEVASYGKDLENMNLLKVIQMIHKVQGIERIRLSSVEPTVITKEFVEQIKNLHKLCPHFHLSLQSGCDETLKRMNRKYDTKLYKQVVDNLREVFSDVAITTDIIVGFPGETEQEFQKTYNFVEQIAFSQIHVFSYSKREGTKAANMQGQVSSKEKEDRSKKMIQLGNKMKQDFLKNHINEEIDVLFEQECNKNEYEGYTKNYISVIANSNKNLNNTLRKVKIIKLDENNLIGEVR